MPLEPAGKNPEPPTNDSTAAEFLAEIRRRDQSDLRRSNAPDCYRDLRLAADRFTATQLEPNYLNALSMEAWHIGQIVAGETNDIVRARAYFRLAEQHAEDKIVAEVSSRGTAFEFDYQWRNYIAASIAYLDGDAARLAELSENVGPNKPVLERLIAGLARHGTPNYARDYYGDENYALTLPPLAIDDAALGGIR